MVVPDHQFHDDGLHAIGREGVVDRDDRRVREPGGGHGLGAEALDERVVGGQVLVEQLHGHPPGERLVGGLPDLGHAARRDGSVQPIPADEESAGQRVLDGSRGGGVRRSHGLVTLVGARNAAPLRGTALHRIVPDEAHDCGGRRGRR